MAAANLSILSINQDAFQAAITRAAERLQENGIETGGLSPLGIKTYTLALTVLQMSVDSLNQVPGVDLADAIQIGCGADSVQDVEALRSFQENFDRGQSLGVKFSSDRFEILIPKIAAVYGKIYTEEELDFAFATQEDSRCLPAREKQVQLVANLQPLIQKERIACLQKLAEHARAEALHVKTEQTAEVSKKDLSA